MKYLLISYILLYNLSTDPKLFEGELVYKIKYSGTMELGDKVFDFGGDEMKERSNFFDTIKIQVKGVNHIKYINKRTPEEKIFIDAEKKVYSVLSNNELMIDDLSYLNLYQRENNYFGEIVAIQIKDTLYKNYDGISKHLVVKRTSGTEIFIFNQALPKLESGRFIIANEDIQILPEQIDSIIQNSIILYYESHLSNMNLSTEIELIKLNNYTIQPSKFEIPKYKENRKNKKFNKISKRFKLYHIIKV